MEGLAEFVGGLRYFLQYLAVSRCPMDTAQQFFLNTHSPEDLPGVMSVALKEPYFPRVVHAEIGHLNQPTPKRPRPHAHDIYHVVLVTGGRGNFLIDGELYPTERGRLFLTGPAQPHCFLNAAGETTEYSELSFAFLGRREKPLTLPFNEVLSTWLRRPCRPVLEAEASPALYAVLDEEIRRIVEAGRTEESDADLWLNVGLARILLGLYVHLFRPPRRSESSDLKKVRDYLHRNYDRKVSLEELAAVACLSPNYLSRRFKQCYGETPIFYQIRLRIAAACEILRTMEDSLEYVAERAGFGDQYYFSRVFKRITGVSPGRYRKESRGRSASKRRRKSSGARRS